MLNYLKSVSGNECEKVIVPSISFGVSGHRQWGTRGAQRASSSRLDASEALTFPFRAVSPRDRGAYVKVTRKITARPSARCNATRRAITRSRAPQFHAVAKHRALRSPLCGYESHALT